MLFFSSRNCVATATQTCQASADVHRSSPHSVNAVAKSRKNGTVPTSLPSTTSSLCFFSHDSQASFNSSKSSVTDASGSPLRRIVNCNMPSDSTASVDLLDVGSIYQLFHVVGSADFAG